MKLVLKESDDAMSGMRGEKEEEKLKSFSEEPRCYTYYAEQPCRKMGTGSRNSTISFARQLD